MNVLSCFDGISCGQLALERAGIPVDNYFASEIDPYAIKVTQKNYPNTIQLGSIENWREWDLSHIDMIIGGSPCQGFSFSGKRLNFDDPRSKLFFVFRDILKHYKPKYFLLENVRMVTKSKDVISSELGSIYPECVIQSELFQPGKLEPIEINSALVSAQSRKRLYWTNIPGITQPEDKHIYLKDIIDDGECDHEKSYCIDANYSKGGSDNGYKETHRRQIDYLSTQDKNRPIVIGHANKKDFEEHNRIYSLEGKSCTIKTYQGGSKPLVVKTIPHGFIQESVTEKNKYPSLAAQSPASKHLIQNNAPIILGEISPYQNDKLLSMDGKSKTVTAQGGNNGGNTGGLYSQDGIEWRKLTVTECERLQTLPDNYTSGISNSRRYHAIGNGWTIDVIVHIFSFIKP